MRGLIKDLPNPNSLVDSLPGLFQEDEFACRFVGAFDTVVAPVFAALDNLVAYLDPDTAPSDFLDWLAGWFGVVLDATWSDQRRRQALKDAVELYRWRGTARGITAQVALYLGVEPQIEESGGVAWSPTPGTDLPGGDTSAITVRVAVAAPDDVDLARVEALVRAAKPAHITHRVEVVREDGQP